MAKRCNSIIAYNNGNCDGPEVPMGLNVTFDLKGNYFLNTKSTSPFGFGSKQWNEIVCNDKHVAVNEKDFVNT